MKKNSIILSIIICLLFAPLAGAFTIEDVEIDGDFEIALVVMSTASEYWLSVRAGAEEVVNELGGEFYFTGPATDADVQGQVDVMHNLIEREVDAILLTALDPDALIEPVQRAEERGIPVVLIDSGIDYEATSFIATDNVEAAKIGTELLADLMNGSGKMVIINALAGIPSNDARNEGARNALENYPDIELLPIQRGADQSAAMENTENILTANPDLGGIFGAFDRGAIGAAEALQIRGLAGEIPFVAFDASPEQIDYLEEGIIDALIVQQPVLMGRMGAIYALMALQGEEVPKEENTEIKVVTRDNMNEPEIQEVLFPLD